VHAGALGKQRRRLEGEVRYVGVGERRRLQGVVWNIRVGAHRKDCPLGERRRRLLRKLIVPLISIQRTRPRMTIIIKLDIISKRLLSPQRHHCNRRALGGKPLAQPAHCGPRFLALMVPHRRHRVGVTWSSEFLGIVSVVFFSGRVGGLVGLVACVAGGLAG